jgi:thiamine biosynthesis lipoprotein
VSGEEQLRFECFGGWVSLHLACSDPARSKSALTRARSVLLDAHRRLSRFDPQSELSRLNRDPRNEVPASPLLRRLVAAVLAAGLGSGGLVDATLLDEIERAGYATSREPAPPPSPFRSPNGLTGPARPHPDANWSAVSVDEEAGTVVRPPGVKLDGGGIAKGLLADTVGDMFRAAPAFAVDCCGDIRIGGSAKQPRRVRVEDPFGGAPLHEFSLASGGVATSGITRRSWTGPDASSAHQLLDPLTGKPAFTGLAQATAVAPSALLAEVYAKAALLSGPEAAPRWLPFGGVLVREDGRTVVVDPERELARIGTAS